MERRLFCTITFTFGILCPRLSFTTGVLMAVTLILYLLWRENLRTPVSVGLITASLLIGLGRYYLDLAPATEFPEARRTTVEGVILEPPRRWGTSSVFFFLVKKRDLRELQRPEKILVQWRGCEQTLAPGDEWSLSGSLRPAEQAAYPGAFDQREWLWSQQARAVLHLNHYSSFHYLRPPRGHSPSQLAYRTRAVMMRRLAAVGDAEARALIAGVVFGETQSLPRELQQQFQRTGTSHLLAASGMNVALLAGIILTLGKLFGFGPWRVAPLAIPAVIGYAFLAGCGPSISRAAAGTTFALLAAWMGRSSNPWNSLCLSVWVLLCWDPRQLYDLGFQLSVVAVIGLMAGPSPPEKRGPLLSSLVLTTSASLVTLPIFWSSFGELSSTLLLANLVLGPIVEMLFPLGLLASAVPVPLLFSLNEKIAQLSLFLVSNLSKLADPFLLAPPSPASLLLLALSLGCWLGAKTWKWRLLALPLVAASLCIGYLIGQQPSCPQEELILRRIGAKKPIYWITSHGRELLVLSEPWQEVRAREMVRKLGSLRTPAVVVLTEGQSFQCRWGEFDWAVVEPLLERAPYLRLRISKQSYRVRSWWPRTEI